MAMEKRKIKRSKLAQVWIETVIYTLIAFVMMGLILSYAKPKIEEIQDNTLLKQSTEMMKTLDSTILTMGAAGNQRVLEIGIKKGSLNINGLSDQIVFEMESKNIYSEPGKIINDGNIKVKTVKKSGFNTVTLTLDYSDKYNLQFDGAETDKKINKASTPYKFRIINSDPTSPATKTIMNINLD